jgi:hypothetical protein
MLSPQILFLFISRVCFPKQNDYLTVKYSTLIHSLICSTIISCAYAFSAQAMPSLGKIFSKPKNTPVNSLTRGTVSDDESFRFEIPADWSPMTGLNKRASLQVGNSKTNEFMIAFSGEKSGDDFNLSEALQKAALELHISVSTRNRLKAESFKIGHYPAKIEKVKSSFRRQSVIYYIVVIEAHERYYQVLFWTNLSRQHQLDLQIPKILSSFVELKD